MKSFDDLTEPRRHRCAKTMMHSVKLLGQHLTPKDIDRQVAGFQVRVTVLNGIGIPVVEAMVQVCPGKGNPVHRWV